MKAVVQRITECSVVVQGQETSSTQEGLLIFVGISSSDARESAVGLAEKIMATKLFPSNKREFAFSLSQMGLQVMVVSQITLQGEWDTKGNHVSFDKAASKEKARSLYQIFIERFKQEGLKVRTGIFGDYMQVRSVNDGPVTFLFEH
jgi:D-tyrosyl-tRNA(Tyr) deacylase